MSHVDCSHLNNYCEVPIQSIIYLYIYNIYSGATATYHGMVKCLVIFKFYMLLLIIITYWRYVLWACGSFRFQLRRICDSLTRFRLLFADWRLYDIPIRKIHTIVKTHLLRAFETAAHQRLRLYCTVYEFTNLLTYYCRRANNLSTSFNCPLNESNI